MEPILKRKKGTRSEVIIADFDFRCSDVAQPLDRSVDWVFVMMLKRHSGIRSNRKHEIAAMRDWKRSC